jgi:ABC-type molybdenum transport system ATPase subunit/photorepair protein PhrA
VYEKKPRTTVDLKQNIREEVAAVSSNMLQRVMQNFQKRLRECVSKGHHLTYSMEQSPSSEANRSAVVKKFPAFYGTPRFITAFTSARHLWDATLQTLYSGNEYCN